MRAHGSSSPVVNALTVDVEDYFQVSAFAEAVRPTDWGRFERRVVANTGRLLDLFAEFDVRATFFVLGWIAEREPTLVKRLAAAGHEVASHGYWHKLVYDQTPQEFRDDIRTSKALLESITGMPVIGYRAPSFSITSRSLWALDVLAEEGFAYDTSIFPIRHDRYGIPSAPRHMFRLNGTVPGVGATAIASELLEIPGSTVRLGGVNLPIGGGGYFRLLPYGWTRWGIGWVNRVESKPVVFYVHPWEVDPGQPCIAARWRSRFRHRTNLDKTEARLRRLLSGFRFDSIAGSLLAPSHAAV